MKESDAQVFPTLRSVSAGAPLSWIAAGWADLRAAPAASLFYGAAFVVIGYLMGVFLHPARTLPSPWPPVSR